MTSFQPSRGRILFEVLCAAGIAASCGGAWLQTGASALLAAAAVATLYALVRFFDLFKARPETGVAVAGPQRIEFEPLVEAEPAFVAAPQDIRARLHAIEPQLVVDNVVSEVSVSEAGVSDVPPVDQPLAVEPAPAPVKAARRTKSVRKGSGRNAAPKKAASVEFDPAPVVDVEVAPTPEAVLPMEPDLEPEVSPDLEPEVSDEPLHPPVAPLFEPEPFVRQQQRAMFGRKAGRA